MMSNDYSIAVERDDKNKVNIDLHKMRDDLWYVDIYKNGDIQKSREYSGSGYYNDQWTNKQLLQIIKYFKFIEQFIEEQSDV